MTRIDGDGLRPGVLIEISGATQLMLLGMQRRLHQMYWDQHELSVHIMSFPDQGQAPDETRPSCNVAAKAGLPPLEGFELNGISKGKRRCLS
jgi:hypothetical protein